MRILFFLLAGTVPLAWLGAWWNQRQEARFGVPDVAIAAPDGKPVLSLDYDPNQAGRLLVAAGDKTPGGGAILWESTDKADSELPVRDAGAFGKVPVRRNRTLRAYGKDGGGIARFSPEGLYIATWSGKLTVWKNDGYHSVPLRSWDTRVSRFYWENETSVVFRDTDSSAPPGRDFPWNRLSLDITKPEILSKRPQTLHLGGEDSLYIIGDKSVEIADKRTGKRERLVDMGKATFSTCAFTPDNTQLAIADTQGGIYRFERNRDGRYIPARKRSRFAHAQNPGPGAPYATSLAFSPDGKTLATGGTDGMVFLWRL